MAFKLTTTLAVARDQIRVLSNIESGLASVNARYQPLVAELMALRLFSIWEQTISEIAGKIACGAPYLNGVSSPLLCQQAKSLAAARVLFSTYSRTKPSSPNWSKASYVVGTVGYVFDATAPFLRHVRNHGSLVNEVRVVRNFSAHRNASARSQFKQLIRSKLGADLRLSAGQLLLTSRRNPMLLRQYLTGVSVALSDICSGL